MHMAATINQINGFNVFGLRTLTKKIMCQLIVLF